MWVILTNLSTFIFFVVLQYYRFKDTGRACSGDFMIPGSMGIANPFEDHSGEQLNQLKNSSHFMLIDQGYWFFLYIILQYILYFISKITSIVITNRLEAEYDEKKA